MASESGGDGMGDDALVAHLRVVADFWSSFDLDSKRLALDQQGMEIRERQEATKSSRKELSESTKSFRKLSEDEKLQAVGPLLKSYQGGIDTLTRRARAAESAFLGLYKELYEAPDPASALREALEDRGRLASAHRDRERLTAELAEVETELGRVSDQQIKVRELQATVQRLEQSIEQRVEQRVAEWREGADSEAAAAQADAEDREAQAQDRVEELQKEVADAQSRTEALRSELFEARAAAEEEAASRNAELEVAHEAERLASERADAAEREVERVRALQATRGVGDGSGRGGDDWAASAPAGRAAMEAAQAAAAEARDWAASLNENLRERDAEVARGREEVKRWRSEAEDARKAAADAEATAQEREGEQERAMAALRAKLEQAPDPADVAALKTQLRAFRAFHYGVVDEDEGQEPAEARGEGAGRAAEATQLETTSDLIAEGMAHEDVRRAVVSRLRAEETRAAHLASECESLKEQLSKRDAEVSALHERCNDHTDTIRRMELEQGAQGARVAVPADAVTGKGGGPRDYEGNNPPGGGDAARESAAGDTSTGAEGSAAPAPASGGVRASSGAIADVLIAQRDRLRTRVRVMEEETTKLRSELDAARRDSEQLRADNVRLFEKAQFLQRMGGDRGQRARGRGREDSGDDGAVVAVEGRGTVRRAVSLEARYGDLYARERDPFREFSAAERRRSYQGLGAFDKVTLGVARVALGTSPARAFLFGYALLLHVLVLGMLFYVTHHPDSPAGRGARGGTHLPAPHLRGAMGQQPGLRGAHPSTPALL